MAWHLTDDAEAFSAQARPLLIEHPVEQTLALTVLERARTGHRWSDEPMVFGWHTDDAAGGTGPERVNGAVLMTPPYPLILAVLAAEHVSGLVAALREAGQPVPAAAGRDDDVHAFTAAWTRDGAEQATITRQRLYRLAGLRPLAHPPVGRARAAVDRDVRAMVRWFDAFQAEAVQGPKSDSRATVTERVGDGRLWLWEDDIGVAAAVAARQATIAGVARLGPVYTPPERRRRGYGAAVTAACARDALDRDADTVVLFADARNRSADSVYRQVGFERVGDRTTVSFESAR